MLSVIASRPKSKRARANPGALKHRNSLRAQSSIAETASASKQSRSSAGTRAPTEQGDPWDSGRYVWRWRRWFVRHWHWHGHGHGHGGRWRACDASGGGVALSRSRHAHMARCATAYGPFLRHCPSSYSSSGLGRFASAPFQSDPIQSLSGVWTRRGGPLDWIRISISWRWTNDPSFGLFSLHEQKTKSVSAPALSFTKRHRKMSSYVLLNFHAKESFFFKKKNSGSKICTKGN